MRRSRTARTSPLRQSAIPSRSPPCPGDREAPESVHGGVPFAAPTDRTDSAGSRTDRRGLHHRPRGGRARRATRRGASRRGRRGADPRPGCAGGVADREPAPVHGGRRRYRRHERAVHERTHSGGSAPPASQPRHGSSGCRPHSVRRTSSVLVSRSCPPTRNTASSPPDRARLTCRRRSSPASLRCPWPGST